MKKRTEKQVRNDSNVKALRRAREWQGLTRKELAERLNITFKAIEKYENGRDFLSEERLKKILDALEVSEEQFSKIKKGRNIFKKLVCRKKQILENKDRRSYQKIITKECRVLRSMRRMKGLSQDEASKACGYSRATIGHIENGRIELSRERIKSIIASYSYNYSDFLDSLEKEVLRDEVVDACIMKIEALDDNKLEIVMNLLLSL